MKVLAEAFVKHAIPLIDVAGLQEAFVQQIKKSSKPELPILGYRTTEIVVDGSEAVEGCLSERTVASVAYDFCDKLPCGTPIGKATSGWAACELLGAVLGPNIYISKRFKSRVEDHPQWLGYTCDIVATFQEKPVKRSAKGLAWWPEDALKQLLPQQAQAQPLPQQAQAQQPQQAEECKDIAERMIQAGILYTTHSLVANEAARLRDLAALGPPPPLERVGATAGEPVISGLARRLFSMPRSTAPGATASTVELPTMARPFLPLECLGAGLNPEERADDKCTFCGEMVRECGGDHGDEMRDIGRMEDRYERRGSNRKY